MFVISVPGRYISQWRLTNPDGTHFGQRVWVEVAVQANSAPTGDIVAIPADDVPAEKKAEEPEAPAPVQASPAVDPIDALFAQFEPAFQLFRPVQPVSTPVSAPEPVPVPVPAPVTAPAPAPAPAPVPVPVPVPAMTPLEEASIAQLREMGFNGDLLPALRNNGYVKTIATRNNKANEFI